MLRVWEEDGKREKKKYIYIKKQWVRTVVQCYCETEFYLLTYATNVLAESNYFIILDQLEIWMVNYG